MSFNLDEYVDVAERVQQFYDKYPDGRLVTTLIELTDNRVVVKAEAFRNGEHVPAGTGYSSLGIPGTTQFTRGSELENAETSAVGRAIAFCGFSTHKGIASRQEVAARTAGDGSTYADDVARTAGAAAAAPADNPAERARRVYEDKVVPKDEGEPARVEIHFGKNKGRALGDLTQRQLEWYAHTWDPDGDPKYPSKPVDRRLKMAAQILLGGGDAASLAKAEEHEGVPF